MWLLRSCDLHHALAFMTPSPSLNLVTICFCDFPGLAWATDQSAMDLIWYNKKPTKLNSKPSVNPHSHAQEMWNWILQSLHLITAPSFWPHNEHVAAHMSSLMFIIPSTCLNEAISAYSIPTAHIEQSRWAQRRPSEGFNAVSKSYPAVLLLAFITRCGVRGQRTQRGSY